MRCSLSFIFIVLLFTSSALGAPSRNKFSSGDFLEINKIIWHSQHPQSQIDNSAYPISTPDDWMRFSQDAASGKSFFLTNDIDMQGASVDPILLFTGSFDGKGHTIRNLTINPSNEVNPGFKTFSLFAVIQSATLNNLTFENITSTIPETSGLIVTGTLAGQIGYSKLSNIHVKNSKITLNHPKSTVSLILGGFAGLTSELEITSSSVDADISVNCQISKNPGFNNIGGFIGRSSGKSSVTDCHSTGAINVTNNTFPDSLLNCGGFIALGIIGNDTFVDSTSQNTIHVSAVNSYQLALGGFAGYLRDANLSGSSYTGNMSADIQSLSSTVQNVPNGIDFNLGGFASKIINTTITTCSTSGTISFSGFFIGGIGGFLGMADPDCSITDSVSAMTRIDLKDVTLLGYPLSGKTLYAAIGGFVALADSGYYDKNRVAPDTQLFINGPIVYGDISSDNIIQYVIGGFAAMAGWNPYGDKPVKMTQCRVGKIRLDSPATMGGFIGYASGLTGIQDDGITPSFNKNTIGTASLTYRSSDMDPYMDRYMGGFAGYLENSILSESTVESATITVGQGTNSANHVGGFVGYSATSSISQSASNATINLADEDGHLATGNFIGGFAGYATGSYLDKQNFDKCSTSGFIQSGDNSESIGGFIGSLMDSSSVFSCFSTTSVTSGQNSSNLGGFVGSCVDATIKYAYSQGPVSAIGDAMNYGGFAGSVKHSTIEDGIASGPVSGASDKTTLLKVIEDAGKFVKAASEVAGAEVEVPIALLTFADNLSDCVDAGKTLIQDFKDLTSDTQNFSGFFGYSESSAFYTCYFDKDTTGFKTISIAEAAATVAEVYSIKALQTTELSFFNNPSLSLNPTQWSDRKSVV